LKAESDVVNRPTAYAETEKMRQADHNRDMVVSLIFNLVDAYCTSTRFIKAKSAKSVQAALSPYRGIQSHEMNRQTTEVEGMIKTLCDTSVQPSMEALGITDTIEELIDANNEFKSNAAQRDAEALRRQPVKEADTKELRSATDELYRKIVEQTNAYAIIQSTADIVSFIDRMNVLVAKYKTVIANQGKKKGEEPNPKTDALDVQTE